MGFFFTVAYIVLTYLSPADLFPTLAPFRLVLVLSIVGMLMSLPEIPMKQVRLFVPQTLLLMGLMGAMSVSRLLVGWYGGAVTSWYEFGVTAAVYFLVVINVQSLARFRRLTILLVLCAMYLVVQGIAAVHLGYRPDILIIPGKLGEADRMRATGWLNDPNDLAQQFVVVLPLLGMAWQKRNAIRNILLVMLPGAFVVYGIFLTRSRGGLMGLMALSFFALRDRMKAFPAAVMSAVALLGLLTMSFGGGRAISISEGSAAARLQTWGEGLAMFKSNPLFGVGFSRFTHHSHYTAHNSFVLAFSEMGLFGYFFWMGLLVFSLGQLSLLIKSPVKDQDDATLIRWARALRISFATFLVTGWFLSRTYIPTLYILIAMAVILTGLYRNKHPDMNHAWTIPTGKWLMATGMFEVASVLLVWSMVRLRGF